MSQPRCLAPESPTLISIKGPDAVRYLDADEETGGSSSLAAIAGYPSITVPMGLVHGLPVGVSFMAGKYQEPLLVEVAFGFEQNSHLRTAPSLQ